MITYEIYQLDKNSPDYRTKSFSSLRLLEKLGLSVDKNDYNLVYTGNIDSDKSITDLLEKLYTIFNCNHPDDFTGHSLSVADIVKIENNCYFCDSFGWKLIEF